MKTKIGCLNLPLLILYSCLFFACSKGKNTVTINYFVTSSVSNQVDNIVFDFENTRAYTASSSDTTYTSVYLIPQTVILNTKRPNLVNLGSSEINMDEIYGYDFWKSNATAAQNGVSMSLKEMAYWEKTFTPMRIIPQKNKVYDVVFEINMDSSLVKQTNGDVKFFPKISSKVTSR